MNTAQSMTDTVRPIRRSRGVKEIKEENEGEIIRVNRYYRRGGINRSLRNIYVSSSRGSCVWSIDQQISFIFSFFNGYHIQQHTHTHTKEARKILLTIRIFYLQIKFHNTILIIDLALVLFSVVFVCERKRERERERERKRDRWPLRSPRLSEPPQLPPVTAVIQPSPASFGRLCYPSLLSYPRSPRSSSPPRLPPIASAIKAIPATPGHPGHLALPGYLRSTMESPSVAASPIPSQSVDTGGDMTSGDIYRLLPLPFPFQQSTVFNNYQFFFFFY